LTPTPEDYEIWFEQPTTQWLMTGLANMAQAARTKGMVDAWTAPTVDQRALDHLKIKAECFGDLSTLTYEDACGLHPQEETNEGS
jgi:hypothetical protein